MDRLVGGKGGGEFLLVDALRRSLEAAQHIVNYELAFFPDIARDKLRLATMVPTGNTENGDAMKISAEIEQL